MPDYQLIAPCPECKRTVSVFLKLGGDALREAFEGQAGVEVVCLSGPHDHCFVLIGQDKQNLRKELLRQGAI